MFPTQEGGSGVRSLQMWRSAQSWGRPSPSRRRMTLMIKTKVQLSLGRSTRAMTTGTWVLVMRAWLYNSIIFNTCNSRSLSSNSPRHPAMVSRTRLPFCMSVCLSVCLFVCISVCLSVCQSVYMFVCQSVYLFVCLSVCLYIHMYVCFCFAFLLSSLNKS